jgi:hypothetical protein
MIRDLQPVLPQNFPLDIPAIKAQVEDAVPWRDGVLTYNQAMALLAEVERLQFAVRERDLRITQLMGILS